MSLEEITRKYCDDKFWDLNKTWNSEVPDFSTCFQETIFISSFCIFFSVIFLINICQLNKPPSRNPLPWTWLNITKLVSTTCLLVISCISFGFVIHEQLQDSSVTLSLFISALSKVILFLFTISITLKHRIHRIATPWLMSIFWLIFTLCCIVLHRSIILKYQSSGMEFLKVTFYLDMVYHPLIYLQLFLSLFPDKKNFASLHDRCIIDNIPFLPYITYCWFSSFIYKAKKKTVEINDFGFLSAKQLSRYVQTLFSRKWQFHISPEKLKSRSLVLALIKTYWQWLLVAFLLDLSTIFGTLLPPLLLDRVIDFVDHDKFAWRGYMYAVIMFIVDFVNKIILNNGVAYFLLSGLQMKTALMTGVYRKCLLLSTASRKNFSSGTISSLMSVDIERLVYLIWNLSFLITLPLKFVLTIYLMWQYIGISTLAGISVLVCLIPFSYFVSRISTKFTDKQMGLKDIRLKYLNEILSGIKIIKLYAWEIPFGAKISEARKQELKLIFYSQLCFIFSCIFYFCAPLMVLIVSFSTYLLEDSSHTLSPTRAFVCLTLMEQLKAAIFNLPDAVAELVQCNISLGRLKNFLAAENKDSWLVGDDPDNGDVLTIKQASFTWAVDSDCTLNDIELHIPQGKLVAVIGPVGSGKSSLLSSILGDMYKKSGSIDIQGSLAYIPQVAWVLNRSLKENILIGKSLMEDKYNKVLDVCCLRQDLEILPAGDNTEIGEKGVNISGGQKQRISLARAVYQDKDIYLLDDTLSAVDVHVGKALFEDVIGNTGLLKEKTRIFVTHELSVLNKVDLIISMKDGRIDEIGTYQELLSHNGSFTSFIQEHSRQDLEKIESPLTPLLLNNKSSHENGAAGDVLTNGDVEKNVEFRLTDEENMELGGVNRYIYWNYIKKLGFSLSFFGLLGYILQVIFKTAGNIWLSKWSAVSLSNVIQNSTDTIYYLEIYGSLGIAEALSAFIGIFALGKGTVVASRIYHKKMLDSVLRSPMSFFDSTPMGRITNRFSSDLDILDTQLFYNIDGWVYCFFGTLAAFYIIGKNEPIFLAGILPLGIIYFTLQQWHLNTYRQLSRLYSTSKSPVYSQLLESIGGITSIDAFRVQEDFISTFEEKVDNHNLCGFNRIICNRWLTFFLDTMGSLIVLGSALIAIYNRHSLTPSEVALMISYSLLITDSLKWLVRLNTELENKSVSIERVDEYCKLKPEAPWESPNDHSCNNWPDFGNVNFDNYCTKYREDLDLVLRDINISVSGGEKVGIIGRTGAGKSSVSLALFRIIEPVSGAISIDNVDITKIGLLTLRSKLTIIPQDPVLFQGTLRFNLDPHNEYNDDVLWESLERAHLKSFVSGLDEGLEYELDEGGTNLSAGQRQLVCLARALLKNSKILVMDEATASVDIETDNLIQNTIRTVFANKTVITIAHRINTILDYDKIIVMEKGSVIEVGKPENLIVDTSSKFYSMCKDAKLI